MTAKKPRVYPDGPEKADILIVGEAPGHEEIQSGKPFVGASGKELVNMLYQVGLTRHACRITNVCPYRPPKNDIGVFFLTKTEAAKRGLPAIGGKYPDDNIREGLKELAAEVARCKPKTIIALGNTALWALTGEWGITKWRGSELKLTPVWQGPFDPEVRVIATYHPAAIMRQWSWRPVTCFDLSKATKPAPKEPEWQFTIGTDFAEAKLKLMELALRLDEGEVLTLAADIETRERSFIDCIGLAWSRTEALCIPFFKSSDYSFLFTPDQEVDLILALRRVLTHSNARIVGQNWFYDASYIARLWGYLAVPSFDTMVAQGVLWPGEPKSLDYLSSIYLQWHRYWKADSAEAEVEANDLKRWEYNCKDCCATWGLVEPMQNLLLERGLMEQYDDKARDFRPLMYSMLRGVNRDNSRQGEFLSSCMEQQADLEEFFQRLQAEAFPDIELAKSKTAKPWYRSPTQLVKLFYEHLMLPVQYNKKTRRPTTDDDALTSIGKKEPVFKPLMDMLKAYRSLGVFVSTFLMMKVGHDRRFRTSYNPVGTETFRLNSTSDPFGEGGNLQNIPSNK